MNLSRRFLELLAERGDLPAVREPDGAILSYADLRRQIIGFAAALKARGFQPGDGAVIVAPNGSAFTVATIAVATLGGISVLAEPGLGDEIYFSRVRAARPKWSLVHPIVLWANRIPGARAFFRRREVMIPPVLPDTAGTRRIMISAKSLARSAAPPGVEPIIVEVDPKADLTIFFTGGTTSMPKGVRLSHEGAMHAITNIVTLAREATGALMVADPRSGSVTTRSMLADTPQQVLYGLVLGQKVLVTRGRMGRRAAMVRDLIEKGETGAYFGSPFLWMEMMEQAGANRQRLPASLKAVFLGGAPVTPEFLKTLRTWLHPDTKVTAIYGMTEAGPVAYASAEEKIGWTGEGDFAGRLMAGITATTTEAGEIMIDSPSLLTGYVGQPPRPAGEGFPTGDLGRVIERDGQQALVLLGRAKDMIIRAGVNIYPATLESGLRAITNDRGQRIVREAALVGLWSDVLQDEVVVLCWQPMGDVAADDALVARRAEAVTGADARPDHLIRVDPMPVTGRQNKVDKGALRTMAAERFGLSPSPRGQRVQ